MHNNLYMRKKYNIPVLYLRMALGIGFILPVMDRFGWLGPGGQNGNSWGNWVSFVDYTHTLMPFVNKMFAGAAAVIATGAELIFAIMFLVGYKVKLAAYGSFLLTLVFALSMLAFAGYRAPFTYSVFVCSAACLYLATVLEDQDKNFKC